jgi:hypothetical protein
MMTGNGTKSSFQESLSRCHEILSVLGQTMQTDFNSRVTRPCVNARTSGRAFLRADCIRSDRNFDVDDLRKVPCGWQTDPTMRRAVDLGANLVREPVAKPDRCILSYGGRDRRDSISKAMQSIILKRACQRFSGASCGKLACRPRKGRLPATGGLT